MTTPVVDDPLAWCVVTELQACFCAELAQTSAPVACCCVSPGEVAWDSCDPGMAWARVVEVYQVGDQFPTRATGLEATPCGGLGGWAVVLELGAVRCMPQPDEQGNLPSCEDVTAVSRLVYADAHAMRRALMCCDWRDRCRAGQLLVGPWQPVGQEGGCVGGVIQATVEIHACICGPDEQQPGPAMGW